MTEWKKQLVYRPADAGAAAAAARAAADAGDDGLNAAVAGKQQFSNGTWNFAY